ncbi:C2 domain in Dock180 and Zizimin protein-domain-containing protein [Salix suchowensis]|nr:C2 domain in Dock180 and Zizimin protein-domain-containing protein [Salix suchowensis]
MLAISAKIFRGDAATIIKENSSLLKDTPHTLRLGFPDVVFPGDTRNELYIKFWSGEFSPGHSGSGRLGFARAPMGPVPNNVQVSVEVKDQDGRTVEGVIHLGSGEPPVTTWNSIVFQRCNQPTFGELIKVQLPPQGMPQCLLSWEKIADKELLSAVLTRFTFVGEVEIVKFLRDIFDSLFGILISAVNQTGEFDNLVFEALVTVLGIVQDRRFSNFQPVLDVYIEKHFNCAAASSHMVHSMNQLLGNPTATQHASHLRAALKVWHYIFKFIARSRELQKAKEVGMGGGATAEHLETTFKRELRNHLAEVNRMMSITVPPSIIGTQTIALQHFTSILPELAKIFSNIELVTVATTFANAITSNKGRIVIWKLIMYLQIVKGFLFDNHQSRPLLVEAVVIWIKPHFGRYDDYGYQSGDIDSAPDAARVNWLENIRLCVTIVAVMLDKLQQNLVSLLQCRTDIYCVKNRTTLSAFYLCSHGRLLESYREFQSPSSRKAIERHKGSSTAKAHVPVTFPESYPFSMVSYLPEGSKGASLSADDDVTFYPGVGETAVVLLVLILSSPRKHIQDFLESCLDIEGRERFIAFLSHFFKVSTSILENDAFPKTWLNINILAHKVLIKMMDPLLRFWKRNFSLRPLPQIHHDRLRNNAVQILYSMIVAEYQQARHFDEIENELVNRLDSLFMSDSKGDDISRTFFIGQLRHLFDTSDVDDLLRERVANFLDSVDLFLELLLSVRDLPEGEEYGDDRVIATIKDTTLITTEWPSSETSPQRFGISGSSCVISNFRCCLVNYNRACIKVPWLRMGEVRSILRAYAQQTPRRAVTQDHGRSSVDIRFGNDQYIQCTAVAPEPNRSLQIFTNPDVPLSVRTYYEHSCSRPIRKVMRDGTEEVWTEKTFFTTEEEFPTVLRRSEVIAIDVTEISPLESALADVESKTKELLALYQKFSALAKTAHTVSTNALSMCLNGAVDAPTNTGVASYRQTFLTPEYMSRNPERIELIEKLRNAIDDQVRTIDSCLRLHGQLCPPEFISFHETLEKFFKKYFRDEIRRLALEDMLSDQVTVSHRLLPTTSGRLHSINLHFTNIRHRGRCPLHLQAAHPSLFPLCN